MLRTLTCGLHDAEAPALYDWASDSTSATRVLVGQASLPEPTKEYFVDFTYSVPQGIDHGAVAMAKFDGARDAMTVFEQALAGCGIGADALNDRNVLYCKGAAFHDDAPFNTMFATALWHGATGDVVFPRLRLRVPMQHGSYVVFDCHEPHGFLRAGETQWRQPVYEGSTYSHFLSIDLERDDLGLRRMFGYLDGRQRGRFGLTDIRGQKVCERSGAYSG